MITPRKIWGGLSNQMFRFAYVYAQMKKGLIPDLYVQSEDYWKECRDDIKAIYTEGMIKSDYVSLHIRRGDYINNPFYVDLTKTDYYDKAIAEFPDEKFLIFCADRQEGSNDVWDKVWCQNWAENRKINFEIWEGKDEIEDMNKMMGCKGHIMANSSFSWWASYLGEGKTIAPKAWFTDGKERIRLLDSWIKI